MFGLPLAFGAPVVLAALLALPLIWFLLRLTPPKPQHEIFPPTRILSRLLKREETPAQSPWWLTLLRLLMAAFVIFAMSLPIWNPEEAQLTSDGPVLLVIDNSWAAGDAWELQRDTALRLVDEAQAASRTVMVMATTNPKNVSAKPVSAEDARQVLEGMTAKALRPDHKKFANAVSAANATHKPGSIIWLSDGLMRDGTKNMTEAMSRNVGQNALLLPESQSLVAIQKVSNEPDALKGTLIRADSSLALPLDVVARDSNAIIIARSRVSFEQGETLAEFSFTQPIELRNEITRIHTEQIQNGGTVQLLDESNRRRLVGIVTGEKRDLSQPLLSPLYYINRALEPFSDLREADDANVNTAIPTLLEQGVSAIVLADVGLLDDGITEALSKWINSGGMLIRFAGPRLAASPQGDLLPVRIRPGDRNLGSSLSWDTPKPLAPFEVGSPFFGLDPPEEVLITRQILALQETNLAQKAWATLEDGTPLVTAEKRGGGWVVLFHVSSDATWSNLPISGTFVEMLRRVVNQSRTGISNTGNETDLRLPPLQLLNGLGQLSAPPVEAKPLVVLKGEAPVVSFDNPPGLYGTEDGYTALNLFTGKETLQALDPSILPTGASSFAYAKQAAVELKPWLLLLAAIALLLDCIAVLWIAGSLKVRRSAPQALILMLSFATAFAFHSVEPRSAHAQSNNAELAEFEASLKTRLAYVITGIREVDDISAAGMLGLTRFLSSRTALEPGEPVGVNIQTDELSFYPLLYWAIDPAAEIPSATTMARIDAFMKQGGSVLFDTRDQISGSFGGTSSSPSARQLQSILSSLDIPPLEPVPNDHVLTKAFYLLDTFPGRFTGGDLWVEALQGASDLQNRPARAGDGVSSLMITSNDLAGAWAIDQTGRPLLPTVPQNPAQRNYAYRVGVNLIMYMLTGNYKADQVHIPALLERLGQ